jgi:diguanylate cyclase (GGDEF)-like protein/PAS domain S-box-containing protein
MTDLSDHGLSEALLLGASLALVAANEANEIVQVTQSAAEMFGYRRDELIGSSLSRLIPPDIRHKHSDFVHAFGRSSENKIAMGRRGTIQGYCKDGTHVALSASIAKILHTNKTYFIATLRDMRIGRLAEEELEWRATHDPLTSLPNRTMIFERIHDAVRTATRAGTLVGILFLDLDGFKLINDAHGHRAGDELLIALGGRLRSVVRPSDMVGRLSEDEFVIVCEDIDEPEEISIVADRIIQDLNNPFDLTVGRIFQSVSIGISFCRPGEDPEQILAKADSAMYLAKKAGRSNWKQFDSTMDQQARRHLSLVSGLRSALANDEMYVVFQPIVDSRLGSTCGFETLLRWRRADGDISPAEFIPIAERSGMIGPIGEWALIKACGLRARLCLEYGATAPYVSVNLSARQLNQSDLAERFDQIARNQNADNAGILIEITESMLMTEFVSAVGIIKTLSALGFRIAIDDFGTGYSSLAQIFRFPLDVIKIDRELVISLAEDHGSRAITRAIRDIANETGKSLIMEGVEDDAMRSTVDQMGCHIIQGFHYSRPLLETNLVEFLTKYPPS